MSEPWRALRADLPWSALRAELPRIRRARDFRLYDFKGRRYLDFWQADGRALLGHRPAGLAAAVKAGLEQGLWAGFPSVWSGRLAGFLTRYFSNSAGRHFRWFASEERARTAAARLLGRELEAQDPREPWSLQPGGQADIARWRPWWTGGDERLLPAAGVVLPVLPFPASFAPQVAVFDSKLAGQAELPESDPVSPVLLAGLARAMVELAAGRPQPDWASWRVRGFNRFGPWLVPAYGPGKHPAVFRGLLAAGLVINPDHRLPDVIPGEWSAGEKQGAERAFAAIMEEADAVR